LPQKNDSSRLSAFGKRHKGNTKGGQLTGLPPLFFVPA